MIKTKPMATLLLSVMAIIFLISYPQRHDAFWAFVMHVSGGAAMIGGLADWYAVTALFTNLWEFLLKRLFYRAARSV